MRLQRQCFYVSWPFGIHEYVSWARKYIIVKNQVLEIELSKCDLDLCFLHC